MWDLVPQWGTEPKPPALGAQTFSHWMTREAPQTFIDTYSVLGDVVK